MPSPADHPTPATPPTDHPTPTTPPTDHLTPVAPSADPPPFHGSTHEVARSPTEFPWANGSFDGLTHQMTPDLLHVEGWVHGWSISRRTPPPVALPEGYRIDVGQPRHLVRYVLPTPQQELIAQLHEPGTWLKTAGALPALSPRWTHEPPEYLMATPLNPPEPGNAAAAAGRVQPTAGAAAGLLQPTTGAAGLLQPTAGAAGLMQLTAAGDALIHLTVELDGVTAAQGKVAVWDNYATFDQIVTEPAYRRRGLGSVVMRELAATAFQQGARTGVLVATEAGRALYTRLGWDLISTLNVAWIRP
jgi:GNAT superfamily N-acetyltransferase